MGCITGLPAAGPCCHCCASGVQASRLSCLPALSASRFLRTIILGVFQGICGALAKLLREVDNLNVLQELTTDRIVAEADLSKQLGTLRYLLGLRSARQRAEAAQEHAVKLEEGQGAQGMLQLISASLMPYCPCYYLCMPCSICLLLIAGSVQRKSCCCRWGALAPFWLASSHRGAAIEKVH